jgi:alcohol dehydrogenase class IV
LCARLLLPVWNANVAALRRQDHPGLERFRETARLLAGCPDATLSDGAKILSDLRDLAQAPPLSRWSMTESDIPTVREDGLRASSMKGNPVDLSAEEIDGILGEGL